MVIRLQKHKEYVNLNLTLYFDNKKLQILNSSSLFNLCEIRTDRQSTLHESGRDIFHLKSSVKENVVDVKLNANLRTEINLSLKSIVLFLHKATDIIDKVYNYITTYYLCDLQAMKLFMYK